MPFGIDIKFVPLTPGIKPRSEPVPSSSFPDLSSFKPTTEEEFANLRRNTELFQIPLNELALWNNQLAETTHRSQSAPQLGSTYLTEAPVFEECHFGFLEEYDPQAMLTDEPSSFAIDADQLSELNQLCAETFPHGIPQEIDTWTTLTELTEISCPDLTSAAFLDDIESFFKTFQNVDDLSQHFDMTDMAVPVQG